MQEYWGIQKYPERPAQTIISPASEQIDRRRADVQTPSAKATTAELSAAGSELTPSQLFYATKGFVHLSDEGATRLKDAFMSMDGSTLRGVARSFAQLDGATLQTTIEQLGSAPQQQLNNIAQRMQNSDQLARMTSALKETGYDILSRLSPAEFCRRLESAAA